MKCLWFILTCLPLLAQDPAALMAMNPVLSPTNISGCVTWCHSDFGVNKDLLGHACADGDSVAEWMDTSGTSHNMQKWQFGVAPIYRANLQNGFGAIDFSQNNSAVMSNSFSSGTGTGFVTNPTTLVVVFYARSIASTLENNLAKDWSANQKLWSSATDSIQMEESGITCTWNGIQSNKWYVGTFIFDNFTNFNVMIVNSKKYAQTRGRDGHGYTGIAIAAFGQANPLQHYVSEIILYNRRLNDTERYSVEMWLKRKYALPDPF